MDKPHGPSALLKRHRLTDVKWPIDHLARGEHSRRSEKGLIQQIGRPKSAESWTTIVNDHPEFFQSLDGDHPLVLRERFRQTGKRELSASEIDRLHEQATAADRAAKGVTDDRPKSSSSAPGRKASAASVRPSGERGAAASRHSRRSDGRESPPRPMIDYLILVPMDEEFECARDVWRNVKPNDNVRIGAFDYYRFLYKAEHGEALVVIAPMGAMGLTWTGLFATQAIEVWKPANVILIGIAGSLVGRRLPLGDVIIPDQVVGYQLGDIVEKDGTYQYEFRREAVPVNFRLLADARELIREDSKNWALRAVRASFEDNKARGLSLGTPNVHSGEKSLLASGNFVVKSKKYAEALRNLDSQVRAVEMEAMGLFDALRPLRSAPLALVVRGISDYADPDKELQDEASGGNFRRSAMRSATQFVLDLVGRRLSRELRDDIEDFVFDAVKARAPRKAALDHDLTPEGEGSRYIAFDPLIERKGGMTEIKQLEIQAKGKKASRKAVQIALCQIRQGWRRIIKPDGSDGVWACSVERSGGPYSLSLVIVAPDPALSFVITAIDEFGRKAPPLTVGPDK